MSDLSTPPALAGTTRSALLPRKGYIVSPSFDLVYFILSPLIGLVIIRTIVLGEIQWFTSPQNLFGVVDSRVGFAIAVWTYAHLFAVVFRSHLNPQIFKLHRVRFTAVPALLFVGLMTSNWVLAIGLALTWFWDIYHSSMQVFGFCRIYDSRMGNPGDKGRGLDVYMSHLVYIAPIFLGLSFSSILHSSLREFKPLGLDLGPTVIDPLVAAQGTIIGVVLVGGSAFVAYYAYSFWQLSKQGYHYSPQKALMLVTTGAVTYYAWTFLHPAGAFFVVNFFHGLQYFAMVWWSEKKHISSRFGLSRFAFGHLVALTVFLVLIFGEGIWHNVAATHGQALFAVSVATVITLMHFWYDGFIWSVQKHQV
jgi:hypothetical protein